VIVLPHTRAYELSAKAEAARAAGDVERGQALIRQAAELDRTYSVRAELFGSSDPRRVQVSQSVRRLIVPALEANGFHPSAPGAWREGIYFERRVGAMTHNVLIGRDKFGGRLGLSVSKHADETNVIRFNWSDLGILTGTLSYRTQVELEAVCKRWTELLISNVFPWLLQE
jgi:hypothetical protein